MIGPLICNFKYYSIDSEEEEDEDEDSAPEDDLDHPPDQDIITNDNITTNNPNGTPCTSSISNKNNTAADINEDHSNANINKSFSTRDGVIVDLLETEVDSLKSKLELTQNELFSIHNSNLDLTTQLRQTKTQAQIQSSPAFSSTNSKKYSFTTANR